MKRHTGSNIFLFICFLFLVTSIFILEVETCACKPSGKLKGTSPPGACNTEGSSAFCAEGEICNIYDCSPHVSSHTKANLTLESFDRVGNGGGPSECDHDYHSDDKLMVALSTGWFDEGKRCNRYINIRGNGKNVMAKVVDRCDSTMGCDSAYDYEPPCGNNIVRASGGVWYALGVPRNQWSSLDIHWSDPDA